MVRWSGWVAGCLDRVGRMMPSLPSLPERPASPEPAARKAPPAEKPDDLLLRALRREFFLAARGRLRRHMGRVLEGMERYAMPFGPPAVFEKGVLRVNTMNAAVAWARDHREDDPAAVAILLAHLVCLVNHESSAFDEADELEWLQALAEDLAGSYAE